MRDSGVKARRGDGGGNFFDHGLRGSRGYFLSVPIRAIRGLILRAVARPAVKADPERVSRRFLRLDEHVAEPGRCTEPPLAFRTCALEFWIFHESGLGGR